MSRKTIIIAVFVFMGSYLKAQNLSVSSVEMVQTDSTCIRFPRYDLNDNVCAVIKVFTSNIVGKLDFKGNIIGDIKADEERYTIYVTNGTKRLKVYHPNYIPGTIDFTQFKVSKKGIEGNRVYYVKISGDNTKTKNVISVSGSRILSFTSEAPLRKLFVNGIEWPIVSNSSKRLMPYGEYEYDAVTDGNVHKAGRVELKPSFGSMIVKIEF